MRMAKIFTAGLIVLLVAVIGSVIGGVCICAYFYKEGRRKRQVRPVDEPVARMVEPFNTKKLWERGRKKPTVTLVESESVKSISINGMVANGPAGDAGGSDTVVDIGDGGEGGINPSSSGVTPSGPPVSSDPPHVAVSLEPQKQPNNSIPVAPIVAAAAAVEVS